MDKAPATTRSTQHGLSGIERQVDRAAFRVVARALTVTRQWRTRRVSSTASAMTATSAAAIGSKLEQAQRLGAMDSAAVLAERLSELLPKASEPVARRMSRLLLDVHLARGEVDAACQLARAHRARLLGSPYGVGALEVLDLDPGLMPGGVPNFLGISRRLLERKLDSARLALLVGGSPKLWLRHPELHLLFASALSSDDRRAALRFWNRFMGMHGLPHLTSGSASHPNALAALSFEPPGASSTRAEPKVSVLIAARNAANTVCYAVDSLLRQCHRNLEVLICDDASEDDTLEVMKARYVDVPRVRLFGSAVQQGPYNLRNALARHATGQFITFHDADDLALPRRIASQVACLKRGELVACLGNLVRVTTAGHAVFNKDQKATRLAMVSLMLRRETLAALGQFRSARFGADLEMSEKLIAHAGASRIGRLRAPLMLSLLSEGSLTRVAGAESLQTGYRAPTRRIYGELIYARYALAKDLSDEQIDGGLRASGNFAEPAEVHEIR